MLEHCLAWKINSEEEHCRIIGPTAVEFRTHFKDRHFCNSKHDLPSQQSCAREANDYKLQGLNFYAQFQTAASFAK